LGRISIGLGNRDHGGRVALADVEVTAGAFRFTGYVLPCGAVTLPPSLADEAMAVAIAKAARQAALAALAERWQDREEVVARRIRPRGAAA
jgi:hypothetical protein